MALIKCPECNKEISDKAPACPHCGCPAQFYVETKDNVAPEQSAPNESDAVYPCPECKKIITFDIKTCPYCGCEGLIGNLDDPEMLEGIKSFTKMKPGESIEAYEERMKKESEEVKRKSEEADTRLKESQRLVAGEITREQFKQFMKNELLTGKITPEEYRQFFPEDVERANAPDSGNDAIQCPICRSTQITAGNKGFGLGKAAVGGLLLGPVGLLGGMIGSKKIEITCLKCGHKWKPGGTY